MRIAVISFMVFGLSCSLLSPFGSKKSVDKSAQRGEDSGQTAQGSQVYYKDKSNGLAEVMGSVGPVTGDKNRFFCNNDVKNCKYINIDVMQYLEELRYKVASKLKDSASLLFKNKYKVLAAAGVGGSGIGYFYLLFRLNKDILYLKKPDLWSKWLLKEFPSSFTVVDEDELITSLLLDIELRYRESNNLGDNFYPLCEFLKDLDKEQRILKRYLFLCKYLGHYHLEKLFLLDLKFETQAKERLERLSVLNEIVWTWLSRRNVSNMLGA